MRLAVLLLALAIPAAAQATEIRLHNGFTEPLKLDASSQDPAVEPGKAGTYDYFEDFTMLTFFRPSNGCDYQYEFAYNLPGYPFGYKDGEPVEILVDAKLQIYVRPVDDRGQTDVAVLARKQPQGFPLSATKQRC